MDVTGSARDYISWDPNQECRKEVQSLLDSGRVEELEAILSSRLAFGTAGLRGPMGAGYNRMNELVVLQTSQGLVKYLESVGANNKRVVIGYDHRQHGTLTSKSFARISAAVFLSAGYKVFLLERFVPTPFVAYGVAHLQCSVGIMVTASHNPKRDNGFKVYWGNGAQIIPPHDSGIAAAIADNLAPWHQYDSAAVESNSHTEDVTDRVAQSYYHSIASLNRYKESNTVSTIRVAYTAMHGVGCQWIRRAFQTFDHSKPFIVPEQAEPDPSFPTVVFPNPEEKGALDESFKFAKENRCTLILANDPDADRLAAAEWVNDKGEWYVFSGNELGVLLGHWQIVQWNQANESGSGKAIPAVLASVVSSRMLQTIARRESITYRDTLTGFKWLGNTALDLKAAGIPVIFSYEEALGYCVGDVICDKDGISAASVFLEMASFLNVTRGITVVQHLQELYEKYGQFVSYNSYVISKDIRVTDRIFANLRPNDTNPKYWASCAGVDVVAIKDATTGYDSTGASTLPVTPDTHMIMYEFANGVSVTLRTSGTEPKIKYYTEIAGKPGQGRAQVEQVLHEFVDKLVDEMLQPEANGLQRA